LTGISDGLRVGLEVEGARVGLLVGLIVGESVVGKSEGDDCRVGDTVDKVGSLVLEVGAPVLKVGKSEGTDDDSGSLSVGSSVLVGDDVSVFVDVLDVGKYVDADGVPVSVGSLVR